MQDGAAVTGLVIAGLSLVAVNVTGNAIYDPIGSILVGNLLGMVKKEGSEDSKFSQPFEVRLPRAGIYFRFISC